MEVAMSHARKDKAAMALVAIAGLWSTAAYAHGSSSPA